MQRVSALLPSWDRSKTVASGPKSPGALDKVFGWAEKIVVPVNRNSATTASLTTPTRFGRENYWPTSLDKECDKAARILKSFCTDGFLAKEFPDPADADPTAPPSTPALVAKKIPPRIIQNAVGLAIFSCIRSGLWMSGSGGAGLIMARKADGTWSPPSGIILHTADLGFVIGVDIYDCVLVINSVQTLELFTRPSLTLGHGVSLTVGPLVPANAQPQDQLDIRWKELEGTVLTYVKARGKYQSVQLDGSLVTERGNENERFYGSQVSVLDILAGNIPKSVPEMRPLFEIIKAAEGRTDYDKGLMEFLAQQPAPGDAIIETPKESPKSPVKQAFGIPDADDPDPFGVIGLEMAGIEIREAGTHLRPTSTQFEWNPSPTSPVFARFSRQSLDTLVSRSNRGSCMSAKTHATTTTDACTQTDMTSTAETSFSRANSEDGRDSALDKLPTVLEPEEVDYTKVDNSVIERLRAAAQRVKEESAASVVTPVEAASSAVVVTSAVETTPEDVAQAASANGQANEANSSPLTSEGGEDADDEDEDEEDEDEEPIICEVVTAATQPARIAVRTSQVTQVIQAKGAIVTIPKRIPPPLPPRSPARASRASKSEYGDVSGLRSPLSNSFPAVDAQTEAQVAEPTTDVSIAQALEVAEIPANQNQGHQKNASSVCTAIDTTITAAESRRSMESSSASMIPPTPRTLDLASSADESDREPQTPQTENGFSSTREQKEEKQTVKEVHIVSPTVETTTVA